LEFLIHEPVVAGNMPLLAILLGFRQLLSDSADYRRSRQCLCCVMVNKLVRWQA